MPISLPRIPRPVAALTVAAIASSAVLLAAPAADAVARSGDVTIAWPTTIVLDGRPVPLTVSSSSLTGYKDEVYVDLYNGSHFQGIGEVQPNKQVTIGSTLLRPGTVVARAGTATTYCSIYSSDPCHLDSDLNWYQSITGLTYHDSAPATAKWASTVTLTGANDGGVTTWTATASHYAEYTWVPWPTATIRIGDVTVTSNGQGVATWVERTSELHSFSATALESNDVWASASPLTTASAQDANPVTSKPVTTSTPGHVSASATASKAASALKKGIPTVRKVVKLTKKNDVNKLLGRSNGYTSAAVLYDKRLSCSSGPGVDCGATIEKFTTTAKAKARAKHIQTLLKRYSFLGTEYETVHGHFLLRVSGDLTQAQAAKYKSAFAKSFK